MFITEKEKNIMYTIQTAGCGLETYTCASHLGSTVLPATVLCITTAQDLWSRVTMVEIL